MLYNLLVPYAEEFGLFNIFRYQTFRTVGAILTAMIVCFIWGPGIIRWLRSKQPGGQPLLDELADAHLAKKGTPTMGGLMILLGMVSGTVLWADLTNPFIWVVLAVVIAYGAIGFYDDYLKLTKKKNKAGLTGKQKLVLQWSIALLAGGAIVWLRQAQLADDPQASVALATGVAVPFFKDLLIPLGLGFIVFAGFVMVGTSNAVNLTDGLDGLAIVPVMLAAGSFGIIAYLTGNAVFSDYLQIIFVPGAGELAIVCGALVGASVGFLWFNAPPAMVFMGDTGSLAVGGALGAISVVTKHEIVLAIIGGLFVLEALSVIIQVTSFKLTGKRVFRMAPLHHHFEKMGWAEPTVVIRFWIIAGILALIGLSTLKLR